jgi:hypothetical protein
MNNIKLNTTLVNTTPPNTTTPNVTPDTTVMNTTVLDTVKRKKNRCNFEKCRTSIKLISHTCEFCNESFCITHCSIETHQCKQKLLCYKKENTSNMTKLNNNICVVKKISLIS